MCRVLRDCRQKLAKLGQSRETPLESLDVVFPRCPVPTVSRLNTYAAFFGTDGCSVIVVGITIVLILVLMGSIKTAFLF